MISTVAKLKRIKAKLQGGADAGGDVPYEVKCACGEPVSGMRRATWIEGECQSCLQSVFVLPTNVYPSTPSVPSAILGGTFADRLKTVLLETFPRREKEPENSKAPVAHDGDDATAETNASTAVAPPKQQIRWRPSLPSIDVKRAVIRIVTPFRVLMLAMFATVMLTGYWMTHQRAVEAAQQTWLKSTDEAQVLLNDREFLQLETLLTTAIEAGLMLGKDDPEWRGTQNLLHETQAFNNIASGGLLAAFHRAYDPGFLLVDDAEALVREKANSGTFVFDSYLRQHPEMAGTFFMELPATPGRHSVEVTIRIPEIRELLNANGDTRVLFAGRIHAVAAPAADSRGAWNLRIAPPSFVLLTNPVLCEELGLSPDDDPDLANILHQQRDFVESSERWEHRSVDTALRAESPETARSSTGQFSEPEE
ncbi:MAG: hypothetical protein P8J37_21460 [Fuerstiella sp.]|nr:hypothetical protein [Fuerstiella sp.]